MYEFEPREITNSQTQNEQHEEFLNQVREAMDIVEILQT